MTKLRKRILIIVLASLLLILSLVYPFFLIGERVALGFERYYPTYDKIDISGILAKDTLSAEDYNTLYMQTGLTRLAIDDFLLDSDGVSQILYIQERYFHKIHLARSHSEEICRIFELALNSYYNSTFQ